MLQNLSKITGLLVLLVAMTIGLALYRDHYAADRKVAKLEQEKRALTAVVSHLISERRVANLVVTDKHSGPDGIPITTLLFVELARDGTELPAQSFIVRGQFIHIDAMVIKFDREDVEAADPLRGHSIALFTRIFGDQETPASAAPIDAPETIPQVYRDADPTLAAFELDLWREFWHLAADSKYAASKGVRVANGQGVWGMFEPQNLYTLTLEADGGLNLASEPLKGIYRAMERAGAQPGNSNDEIRLRP
jgi:hypothetical protein